MVDHSVSAACRPFLVGGIPAISSLAATRTEIERMRTTRTDSLSHPSADFPDRPIPASQQFPANNFRRILLAVGPSGRANQSRQPSHRAGNRAHHLIRQLFHLPFPAPESLICALLLRRWPRPSAAAGCRRMPPVASGPAPAAICHPHFLPPPLFTPSKMHVRPSRAAAFASSFQPAFSLFPFPFSPNSPTMCLNQPSIIGSSQSPPQPRASPPLSPAGRSLPLLSAILAGPFSPGGLCWGLGGKGMKKKAVVIAGRPIPRPKCRRREQKSPNRSLATHYSLSLSRSPTPLSTSFHHAFAPGMERRPMAPPYHHHQQHQAVAAGPTAAALVVAGGSLDFHHALFASAASAADFGHLGGGSSSTESPHYQQQQQQQSKDIKLAKQEMLSSPIPSHKEQQQNGYLAHQQAQPSSSGNGTAADFFCPSLHQFLLPPHQPLAATDFAADQGAVKNGGLADGGSSSNFYDIASAAASSFAPPADPVPSTAAGKRSKGGHHGGGSSKSADRKRPYPCSLCVSRFGSKMELEEHQNSHTGQKPFQCDVCQSRFNRRSTLWNHKRIHSDAKPFMCTVCHMQFKWKNSLKCHKEMHLRKNELSHSGQMPDSEETHALTYATAAKKKMGELTGTDPASITLMPAANACSRLVTCAGTPRKRAPPKQHQSQNKNGGGGGGKAKSTKSVKAICQQQQQTTATTANGGGGGHQPPNDFMAHFDAAAFHHLLAGNDIQQQQQQQQQQKQQLEMREEESGGGGKVRLKMGSSNGGGAGGQQQQRNNLESAGGGTATTTAAGSSSLDFFRLQCGSTASLNNGLHGGLSSSDHTQQQQAHFLQANFDPLLRPGPSVYCPVTEQQQLHQQQLALEQQTNNSHHGQQLGQLGAASSGSNLLAVGTALTAQQLQLSLEQQQHLLMQDFQPCFDQQSLRHFPTASFLGFDLNSLACIQQQPVAAVISSTVDPASSSHIMSHTSTASSSGTSSSVLHFPASSSSSSTCTNNAQQFIMQQSGQQQTTSAYGHSSAATSASFSSASNSVLNGYQFDPSSVRFLAAAAEISSPHSQQQQQARHHHSSTMNGLQQQQAAMASHSSSSTLDYNSLFCYGQPYNNNNINSNAQQQQPQQHATAEESSRDQQQHGLFLTTAESQFAAAAHLGLGLMTAEQQHNQQQQQQQQQQLHQQHQHDQFMDALAHEQQHLAMGAAMVGGGGGGGRPLLVKAEGQQQHQQQSAAAGGVISAMSY